MTEKGEGRMHIKKEPNSAYYISIPSRIVYDSRFNFEDGEPVLVEIAGDRLIISKKPTGLTAPDTPEDRPKT